MRTMHQAGFTIIETILFLAISGGLTIAIIVGSGMAIGTQRYKDAVATLQSDMQQQFEDAVAIKNSRQGAGAIASCIDQPGQSNCILLGKLLTISPGTLTNPSGTVHQSVVYGREPSTGTIAPTATEYDIIRAYNPAIVPDSTQSTTLEWGTDISWPREMPIGTYDSRYNTPREFGMMVIRSPQSGLIYTFTRDSTSTADLSDMIVPANQGKRTVCVAPSGWVVSDAMSVTINARASSASAVEVRTNAIMTELRC